MLVNREQFYAGIRTNSLFDTITQEQVDSMNAILDEWDKRQLPDFRWLAYMLGTIYHETGRTMLPIEEVGKGSGHKYGQHIKYSGEAYTTPNQIYYGRGYTQNTWYEIYDMLTQAAKTSDYSNDSWDFLNHPELLLQVVPSVWATFYCMLNGKYTGVSLKHYFTPDLEDWTSARKIINGLDCAGQIADYSKRFYKSLILQTA